jgi:hypothetical protein
MESTAEDLEVEYFEGLSHLDTPDFMNTSVLQSNTWEWKEGRFFAYELILKFMLSNYSHYVSNKTHLYWRFYRNYCGALVTYKGSTVVAIESPIESILPI